MVTVGVKGVSGVCHSFCGQPGDKQLPDIVGMRERHHMRFLNESHIW